MVKRSLVIALVTLGLVSAAYHPATVPCSWMRSEVLQLDNTPVPFVLSLREPPRAIAAIKKTALAVSDPRSPQYGQFLSSAEIANFTQPSSADVEAVTSWLAHAGVSFSVKGSRVVCTATARQAEELFATTFSSLVHRTSGTAVRRAGSYWLPEHIEPRVAAIFGLHGLPVIRQAPARPQPVNVTPSDILSTYKVGGVTPRAAGNRQAVVSLNAQYMSDKDLAQFFKDYVREYTVGKDDKVSQYVGDKNKPDNAKGEATLDIQYIMGTAPGLKTEFWLYDNYAFCHDWAAWTTDVLADNNAPLVHSASYGYQGDLKELQCTEDQITVVDTNFAKLAAMGISIIFASGDKGSGYSPGHPHDACDGVPGEPEEYSGKVASTLQTNGVTECCWAAVQDAQQQAKGWSFQPKGGPAPSRCKNLPNGTTWAGTPDATVKVKSKDECCTATAAVADRRPRQPGPEAFWNFIPPATGDEGTCDIFLTHAGVTKNTNNTTSGFLERRTTPGNCTLYTSVDSKKPNPAMRSAQPRSTGKLWPAWPASSPWVTAVGATRFVGQKVGNEEMASDEFGSGGGFSWRYNISDHATYQQDAVNAFLATKGDGFVLPAAGSFPPGGRATPDVSLLGEGYLTIMDGAVELTGGTSASTPVFAGLISLINDARLSAGKKPMGFLNPWIYANQDCFTDVVKGNNAISFGGDNWPYGFNATKGWDPVTGVGTPLFDKMLAMAVDGVACS